MISAALSLELSVPDQQNVCSFFFFNALELLPDEAARGPLLATQRKILAKKKGEIPAFFFCSGSPPRIEQMG